MTDEEIIGQIELALAKVINTDLWLLKNDISEQSISHKIATYLEPLFPEYDVDCEYNGDIDRANNKKHISILKMDLEKLGLLRDNETNDLEKEYILRSVFPDIIIHKRGNNENNLCIIEVKKSTSKIPYDFDFLKLKSYTSSLHENNLKYQLGVFVEAQIKDDNSGFSWNYFKNGDFI